MLLRAPVSQAERIVSPEDVITPAKLKKLKEDGEANHDVVFDFITNTGHPIEDDAGYDLIFPDGRIESAKLANSKAERRGVKPGTYTLRTKYIRGASWLISEAQPFERVGISVSTRGFPDGTAVEIAIRPSWAPPTSAPLAKLQAKVAADSAEISWAYEQPVGDSPYQKLVFQASIGKKKAWSGVLVIKPDNLETPRGAQDRLRALCCVCLAGTATSLSTDGLRNPLDGKFFAFVTPGGNIVLGWIVLLAGLALVAAAFRGAGV